MKPKVELATLREIPRGNFIESNALYEASTEADTDSCYLLPKIQREQISLAKFLGSGAFGEVRQQIFTNFSISTAFNDYNINSYNFRCSKA